MSELSVVKERIYDEGKIEDLLEGIGCQNVRVEQQGRLIVAQLPDKFSSDNKRAVQVKNTKNLSCKIRNRSDFEGDIFNLVSFIYFDIDTDALQHDIVNAKDYICDLFGWEIKESSKGFKNDKRRFLQKLKSKHTNIVRKVRVNKIINENVLTNNFIQKANILWAEEGISEATQRKYDIGFDLMTGRITVPLRNRFGQLVGVKGRIFHDNESNSKYMFLFKCNQSYELFNLWIAEPHIKKKKEVIIVEGEKSCMKFYEHGIYNVVALGSSDLTDVQLHTLLSLGLDIKVVLAYDSDKTPEEIQKTGLKIRGRKVTYIYDTEELLSEKSAPIDEGIKVWKKLYKECQFEIERD